ncbi:MAG: hypothetical protein JNK82_05100 [Myxococcaceae bacterium]|nr:hypothetical protein [Myxococcaceae bacterium]
MVVGVMKRLLAVVTMLVPAMAFAVADVGERVAGAAIPNYARKVAENRFRVSEDWENIQKFYAREYPSKSYPWKTIIKQPGVRAFHIVNPSGKGWEGINVYEANDEIRVYVVLPESAKTKAKKSGKK